jgi:hypothetical protein
MIVDPACIFSNGKYEQSIASALLKQHNVDNIKNCDDRLLLKKMISGINFNPDIVVIGTSRSLEISSDFFPNKKFINCSVSHANMNDFIAIVGLLDSCNKLPAEIYIETSPILINPSPTDEWISLETYYNFAIKKMKLSVVTAEAPPLFLEYKKKIKAMFSFEYFQNSIKFLWRSKNNFVDVGANIPQNFGRMNDCSITYSLAYKTPDTIKAISDAPIYMSKSYLPNLDTKYLKVMEQIINYLASKNVKVSLVNIPFQPDCYTLALTRSNVFYEIKKGIVSFAQKNKVKLIGTFNPFEAHLIRSHFYDPLHCNKKALQSVFKIVDYNSNLNDTTTLSSP